MRIEELPEYLNGLRAATSWAILALHSTNAVEVRDGQVVGDGPRMMEVVRHGRYWQRQGRIVPEYLWHFRDLAMQQPELTGQVVGDAENTLFVGMVAKAWEYVLDSIERNRPREQRIYSKSWAGFAKTVRNCAFHSGRVYAPDGVRFPVTWRDLTIATEMARAPLQITGFFDMQHAFQIVEDMHADAVRDFRDPEESSERAKS